MQIIKLKEVLNKTRLGWSAFFNLINVSGFPKPIPLGLRAVGWLESEVEGWIITRVQSRDALTL